MLAASTGALAAALNPGGSMVNEQRLLVSVLEAAKGDVMLGRLLPTLPCLEAAGSPSYGTSCGRWPYEWHACWV